MLWIAGGIAKNTREISVIWRKISLREGEIRLRWGTKGAAVPHPQPRRGGAGVPPGPRGGGGTCMRGVSGTRKAEIDMEISLFSRVHFETLRHFFWASWDPKPPVCGLPPPRTGPGDPSPPRRGSVGPGTGPTCALRGAAEAPLEADFGPNHANITPIRLFLTIPAAIHSNLDQRPAGP